jgi:hypothetical protein
MGSEAARAAANFFAQRTTLELCKSFIEFMYQKGEAAAKENRSAAAGGRVRNNYILWGDWMAQSLSTLGLLIEEPVQVKPGDVLIPLDPIEAMIHLEKLSSAPPKIKVPTPIIEPPANTQPEPEVDLTALLGDEVDKANQALAAEKGFLIAMCETAENLSGKLIERGATLGISELRQDPCVICSHGKYGVLVQSFTVMRHGTHYKCDFKANNHPVTRYNSDMFVQGDSEKLIRSNRNNSNYRKGKNEFFVKGMNYKEGSIYSSYVMVDGNERPDLAIYYQLQEGQAVRVDEKRSREVETLLASGRDPALSIKRDNLQPSSVL